MVEVDHPFARCYERRLQLANEEAYLFGLAQRFAYVLPEPHLLDVIRRYPPLVELGAGTGYWAYLLRLTGADVIAYTSHLLAAGSRTGITVMSVPGPKFSMEMRHECCWMISSPISDTSLDLTH